MSLRDIPMTEEAICADLEHNVVNPEHTDPRIVAALRESYWYDLNDWLPARSSSRRGTAMGKGYAEGPAAEERFAALERGEDFDTGPPPVEERQAVYGSTADNASKHFIGWVDEVDADKLFSLGQGLGHLDRARARGSPSFEGRGYLLQVIRIPRTGVTRAFR